MERIFVWDDGHVTSSMAAEAEAYGKLEFDWAGDSDDDDSDASDSESESESDASASDIDRDSEGGRRIKRKRQRRDSDDGESDAESDGSRRRRRKSSKRKGDPNRTAKLSAHDRNRMQNVVNKYYHRGTTMGMSVTGLVYLLSCKLGRQDNEALWSVCAARIRDFGC